jgi:hypothetical protein
MDITVDRRMVTPGARIAGTVAVTAHEDLEGRGLRVRLRGYRSDATCDRFQYDGGAAKTVAEPVALRAGVTQSFPFTLDVPLNVWPTFATSQSSLHWLVEVFVDPVMFKHPHGPTGSLEIVVHRPAGETPLFGPRSTRVEWG